MTLLLDGKPKEEKRQIRDYLSAHESEMIELLRSLVLIQSYSYNKAGVDAMVKLVISLFSRQHVRYEIIAQKELGNHLVISSTAPYEKDKQILLLGHTDTVFSPENPFRWFRQDDQHAYGPGVIDMKGGLVVGIYALKVLDHLGLLEKIPIRFIFNSDEEIGSPTSQAIIEKEAGNSSCAFVLECGGLNNEVVTGRKGKLVVKLLIIGQAGHAAFAGPDKPSAILEMAHKIIALESLNRSIEGLRVNVGKVEGGTGYNVVADKAVLLIDVRFNTIKDRMLFLENLTRIVSETVVAGNQSQYTIVSERPAMEQTEKNKALYAIVARQARMIDLEVNMEFRSGCSDANFVSRQGIPVVDGLGPVGNFDHSDKEYIVKDSLLQRTILLALTIISYWRDTIHAN